MNGLKQIGVVLAIAGMLASGAAHASYSVGIEAHLPGTTILGYPVVGGPTFLCTPSGNMPCNPIVYTSGSRSASAFSFADLSTATLRVRTASYNAPTDVSAGASFHDVLHFDTSGLGDDVMQFQLGMGIIINNQIEGAANGFPEGRVTFLSQGGDAPAGFNSGINWNSEGIFDRSWTVNLLRNGIGPGFNLDLNGSILSKISCVNNPCDTEMVQDLSVTFYLGIPQGVTFIGSDSGEFLAANPVPEPETYAMMLAGLGLLGVMARRRKQQLNA